ncbi:TetR/AcrR family transcriptional regulator [Novosphingobium sediminicola]|uniref:TetR/AcrR family tetracycline transcriptional repressor n=1 Tax=Novosphingobium sediminicola TaxID=563162 RepID=A0A7W6CJD8_9SPHN|nr:TetR family transcriptional regulator [Novosphingobium sediminicola]MBB3954785.1 TetR/AcrR family tetracycline transcriptional repressor [Novosphingobium sediminicola]
MCSATTPSEKPGTDASPAPLSAERIVGEAIALMQEQGLDAVSLRRLAGRLGVQAMSIYWHIPNKEELLRRMSQRLYALAMADMPQCATWQDWARAYGRALWTMYHSARDAARLTFSLGYVEEDFRNFREYLAQRLQPLGLSAAEAVQLHSAIQALVIGWAGFDNTYGEVMGKLTPIEPAVMDSLEALIVGSECLRRA